MPKVSVIIPVYNVEKYLRACLDSVCAQTLKDIEIICVDDGSTDSSPAILDEYAAKDSRFKVIKRTHSNAGACRNAGLDIAKGEYLSFLDADDVFAQRMLEVMSKVLDESTVDVVSCRYRDFHAGDDLTFLDTSLSWPQVRIVERPPWSVNVFTMWISWAWDKLFRRTFIVEKSLRFQEIASWNDLLFVNSALALATAIAKIENVFAGHRKHDSSIMATALTRTCFADAHLMYYRTICSQEGFRENERFIKDFCIAALRNARTMLLNVRQFDDFCIIYNAAKRMFKEFNVHGDYIEDFPDWVLRQLYEGFRVDDTPFMFLRKRLELEGYRTIENETTRRVKSSLTYLVGNVIVYLPRRLIIALRGILGKVR